MAAISNRAMADLFEPATMGGGNACASGTRVTGEHMAERRAKRRRPGRCGKDAVSSTALAE